MMQCGTHLLEPSHPTQIYEVGLLAGVWYHMYLYFKTDAKDSILITGVGILIIFLSRFFVSTKNVQVSSRT